MDSKMLDARFQLKALTQEGSFEGYGAVFDAVDRQGDRVARGAFRKTLEDHRQKGRMPAMLWQHDTREPIGVWDEMAEDDQGLLLRGRLFVDDIPRARQAHALLKNKGLSGLSIGFRTLGSGASDSDALYDLVYATKSGYRQDAVWMMNKATANVLRKLRDADDNRLWQQSFQSGQPNQLLGYPVVEAEDMPDIAADAYAIAFGNFQVGYTIVDRQGLRVLRDPYTANPYIKFDFTKRVGGDLVQFEAIKLMKFATT